MEFWANLVDFSAVLFLAENTAAVEEMEEFCPLAVCGDELVGAALDEPAVE